MAILLALGSITVAQHQPHEEDSPAYRNFKAPQARYQMQGEVLPQEGLIKGSMDITYENRSSEPISIIALDLNFSPYPEHSVFNFHDSLSYDSLRQTLIKERSTYCWIDSILFQAARLKTPPVITADNLLEITLPKAIKPGGKIPLILMFTTRFSQPSESDNQTLWELLPNWFPQVASYADGEWFVLLDSSGIKNRAVAEYRISLIIDSSYSLIGPGDLFNEKEHYGTFEQFESDTVFTDVTAHPFAFRKDQPYQPKFDGGIKQYHFRLLNGHDFPLVVADRFLLDRTSFNNELPIEIYYRPGDRPDWQYRVAQAAAKLSLLPTIALVVRYPFPKLMIVSSDDGSSFDSVREMISLNQDSESEAELEKILGLKLKRSWVGFRSNFSDSTAVDVR